MARGLPKSCSHSYLQYKEKDQRLLRWLLSRAEELKISLDGAHSPLPTKLSVSQLFKLATKLAAHAASRVPEAVIKLLDSVIELRTKHRAFYSQWTLNSATQKANKGHSHYLETLLKIRSILGAVSGDVGMELAQRFAHLSLMSLSGIEDSNEEPGGEQSSETSTASRPLVDFDILPDDDDTEERAREDAQFAAWCLLEDVAHLREYIREVWTEYLAGDASLLTASFITTQAAEIVREMEADFHKSFSKGKTGDYRNIARAVLYLDFDLSMEHFGMLLESLPRNLYDLLSVTPYIALWKYGTVVQPGQASVVRDGFFGTFNPNADRGRMTRKQQKAEDFTLIMTHISEIGLVVAISDKPGWRTLDEVCLIEDLRTFIKTSSRPIPLSLVFQWEAWKDIALVNRHDLASPVSVIHTTTENVIKACRAWLRLDFRYDPYGMADMKESVRTNVVELLGNCVSDDWLAQWKRKSKLVSTIVPYGQYAMNPWACGTMLSVVLFIAHHTGVQLSNGSGFLSATLQLYHALREYGKVERWRFMDRLLDICAPSLYPGGRPSIGSFDIAYAVSVGKDPEIMRQIITGRPSSTSTFVETGHGTGVLPPHLGGSILARLSEELQFKVDDEIIAKLFPRPEEANSNRPPESKPRPRFGGSRCEPYGLLAAIRRQAEIEVRDSALTLDLFQAECVGIAMFRRWEQLSGSVFKEAFGPKYIERESQLPYLASWLFMSLEAPKNSKVRKAGPKLLEGATTAFKESRADVLRAMDNGAKMTYLP